MISYYHDCDSFTVCIGERFEISWEDGLKLYRVYSKEIPHKKKLKIRDETQEYPNKPLEEAFMDKLKDDNKEEERVDGFNI
jgi:hypothetical protein